MSKKQKIDKMHQAHGQVERKYKSLDELFGGGDLGKYKTLDVNEYIKSLDEMNLHELQTHARTIGLVPIDDAKRIKRTLIEEFKSFAKTYSVPNPTTPLKKPTIPKEISQILAEGQ